MPVLRQHDVLEVLRTAEDWSNHGIAFGDG
jgi:hypothetical protein